MKHRWGQSYASKAVTVVLTTLFLWGTGLSMLAVLIEAFNGFANDAAELDAAFVSRVVNEAYTDIDGYIHTALSDKYASMGKTEGYVDYGGISYYRGIFDPSVTNLRFHAVNAGGEVIVSNDGGSESAEMLGQKVYSNQYTVSAQRYEVRHIFSDFTELQRADMTSFLDNSADYQLWYFTDSDVQNAHDNGVEVEYGDDKYTDVLYFESEAEAAAFDYYEQYGDYATWEILPNHTARRTDELTEEYDAEEMPYKAVVTAYRSGGTETISIAEYYRRKQTGGFVRALEKALEDRLSSDIEVTVVGNHTIEEYVTATIWLPKDLPVADAIRSNYGMFSLLRGKAELICAALFLFGIATILSGIAMCSAAGHAEGTDEIVIPSVHTLPYGFFWLLPIAALFGGVLFSDTLWNLQSMTSTWRVQMVFLAGITLCIAVTSVLWLYTTAIRVKSGTFWSSFGIVRLMRSGFSLLRHKPLACLLTAAAFTGLILFNVIAASSASALILPALGLDVLALILILYCIYSYFTLHQHLRQITLGNFEPERYVIPLTGDFLCFDSELNTLTDSVGEMVARQMKAEHLRTELITNVSHDLKTPLTSIVNYVDLLSREQIGSEAAQEYLDVLRRQAARLKKLTTDLVDASKASTGNITVEKQTTNVQVLLDQFGGEYEERLRQNDLELVLSLPDPSVYILADGRLIMRVFDNLLNNACKYALKGTRVYLNASADAQTVTISMKNISAAPLNVSPDELMERFVRGDSSRHTEGSGLGLSIARDLTALQGGVLTLHTDGDLFKAELTFPRYEPPALPEIV